MSFLARVEFLAPGNVQAKEDDSPGVSSTGFEVGPNQQGGQLIPYDQNRSKFKACWNPKANWHLRCEPDTFRGRYQQAV